MFEFATAPTQPNYIIQDDPEYKLSMDENLYCLAFSLSIRKEKLTKSIADSAEGDSNPNFDAIPNNFNLLKVYQTTFFCFFCQVSFSIFLLLAFISQNKEYYIVSWQI